MLYVLYKNAVVQGYYGNTNRKIIYKDFILEYSETYVLRMHLMTLMTSLTKHIITKQIVYHVIEITYKEFL